MKFVRVPAGEFLMGSPPEEPGREDQEVLHRVTISQPFFLGQFEVTQRQWELVMGENPSSFAGCAECPVERINFFDVMAFIEALEEMTGHRFRLPTEAEWEYACRAGTSTPFHTGDQLTTDDANYDGSYPYDGGPPGIDREATTPVGSFSPNSLGLYDMHGNVWEWTEDWHCPYPTGAVTDPLLQCDSELRVIRGGSWYFDANSARCALRYTHRPQDLGFSIGVRLIAEPAN